MKKFKYKRYDYYYLNNHVIETPTGLLFYMENPYISTNSMNTVTTATNYTQYSTNNTF